MTQTQIVIEDWKPMHRNTLLGFARVRMQSGTIFHDVSVHCSNGQYWASPASKPQIDRTGMHMRGINGKPLYVPVVSFASKETRDRFSAGVVAALRASNPEAFETVRETADVDA
jgi:hypothetical protein